MAQAERVVCLSILANHAVTPPLSRAEALAEPNCDQHHNFTTQISERPARRLRLLLVESSNPVGTHDGESKGRHRYCRNLL